MKAVVKEKEVRVVVRRRWRVVVVVGHSRVCLCVHCLLSSSELS
jgi:hypothetical protein